MSMEGNGFLPPKAGTFLLVVVFHCGYFKPTVWADACYKTKERVGLPLTPLEYRLSCLS